MEIRPAEISALLKQQIPNFGTEADGAEVGQVLSKNQIGDGIARFYGGPSHVQGREMVAFPNGSAAWRSPRSDNVGVVVGRRGQRHPRWRHVKRHRAIASAGSGRGLFSARRSTRSDRPLSSMCPSCPLFTLLSFIFQ